MHLDAVREVIACLPDDRTLFHYFPQRYALVLLSHLIREPTTVAALRRRAVCARLLEKPVVKAALSACGNSQVDGDTFRNYWPAQQLHSFVLTLGVWGRRGRKRWYQTSRDGHNLVLQLNINSGDMACLKRFAEDPMNFNWAGHPCRRSDQPHYRETLAWARLDADFQTNEVLIEEIQSDFVRELKDFVREESTPAPALASLERELRTMWSEAILTATLEFIWNELGIDHVYYHEFETGNWLKYLRYGQPPRSLYEQLPRRFGMTLTHEAPRLLLENRASAKRLGKHARPAFFRLSRTAQEVQPGALGFGAPGYGRERRSRHVT